MPEEEHQQERARVLVIRLWYESGHLVPFRARMIASSTSEDRKIWSVTTADPEEVLETVRSWLAEFANSILE